MNFQTPKAKNEQHLNWIRNRPCLICGDWTSTEAAHVRYAAARYSKPITGTGIKPRGPNGEECYVNPLCSRHHRAQHGCPLGEEYWWKLWGLDPIATAMAFWINSGHDEEGDEIANAAMILCYSTERFC